MAMAQTIEELIKENSKLLEKLNEHFSSSGRAADNKSAATPTVAPKKNAGDVQVDKSSIDDLAKKIASEIGTVLTTHLSNVLNKDSGGGGGEGGGGEGGGRGGGSSTSGNLLENRNRDKVIGRNWDRLVNSQLLMHEASDSFMTALADLTNRMYTSPITRYLSGQMAGDHLDDILRDQKENTSRMFGDVTDSFVHDWNATFNSAGASVMSFAGTVEAITSDLQSGRMTYASYMGSFEEYGTELRTLRKDINKALGPNGSMYNFAQGDTQTDLLQSIHYSNILQGRDVALNSKEMRDMAIQRQDALKTIAKYTGQSFDELVKMNTKDIDFEDALARSGLGTEIGEKLRLAYNAMTDERQKKLFLQSVQSREFGQNDYMTRIALDNQEAIITGEGKQMAASVAEFVHQMEKVGASNVEMSEFFRKYSSNSPYVNENMLSTIVPGFSKVQWTKTQQDADKMGQGPAEDDANLVSRIMNQFQTWVKDSPLASLGKWLSGPAGLINALTMNTIATGINTVALLKNTISSAVKGIVGFFGNMFKNILPSKKFGPATPFSKLSLMGQVGRFVSVVGKLGVILGAIVSAFEGFKQILFGPGKESKERFSGAGLNDEETFRANLFSGISKVGLGLLLLNPVTAPFAAVGLLADILFKGKITDSIGIFFEKIWTGISHIMAGEWSEGWDSFTSGLMQIPLLGTGFLSSTVSGMKHLFGIQEKAQKETISETEKLLDKNKDKTVDNQRKIHRLIFNGTDYYVAPGSQGAMTIDLKAAKDVLNDQADDQQFGFTDEEILKALIDGNKVNKEMLAALVYMAKKQGRDLSPAYDTNPDKRRMGQ